jgi:site-specific recombinase XerD
VIEAVDGIVRRWHLVGRAARRANVRERIHILRHTFCSHLAMKGATTISIKELAGHQQLTTTQRYMHLSPAEKAAAIRLLGADTRPNERSE